MTNSEYHVPVLLQESIDALNISADGKYVDATFGGGGHSSHIMNYLDSKGSLYAFDQDEDAVQNIPEDDKLIFIHSNFKHLKRFMRFYGVKALDGILMDLGVSSYQFDSDKRGFAHRMNQDLDMKMAQGVRLSAKEILNEYSEQGLLRVLSEYGELRNSKSLAAAIVEQRRQGQKFETTMDLNQLLERMRIGDYQRYFAQVYQALRIEVNDEMAALKLFLKDAITLLKPGGRLVVISYHSLEDRLVKNFMKTGNAEGELIKDAFGKIERPMKLVTKKPILPDEQELKVNTRARSAKLRVAEKI